VLAVLVVAIGLMTPERRFQIPMHSLTVTSTPGADIGNQFLEVRASSSGNKSMG
jgi:hypothetical protein